jgi:hypothetical protein
MVDECNGDFSTVTHWLSLRTETAKPQAAAIYSRVADHPLRNDIAAFNFDAPPWRSDCFRAPLSFDFRFSLEPAVGLCSIK